MITVKNSQRKIKVDTDALQQNALSMLQTIGYDTFDLGILLTTNKTIQQYNKKYRKINKPTDILSFPHHDKLKAGKKIVVKSPEDKNLGDLIISLEYAQKKADEFGFLSLDEYLLILLAHGIAHVIGYDHTTEKEYVAMQKVERKLLESAVFV